MSLRFRRKRRSSCSARQRRRVHRRNPHRAFRSEKRPLFFQLFSVWLLWLTLRLSPFSAHAPRPAGDGVPRRALQQVRDQAPPYPASTPPQSNSHVDIRSTTQPEQPRTENLNLKSHHLFSLFYNELTLPRFLFASFTAGWWGRVTRSASIKSSRTAT